MTNRLRRRKTTTTNNDVWRLYALEKEKLIKSGLSGKALEKKLRELAEKLNL